MAAMSDPLACRAKEQDWALICQRESLHEGHHYGANSAGTHEGWWGAGVVHVSRTLRRARHLAEPVEPDKMSV